MIKSKIQGAIAGALLADSLSLGYHWIYDTTMIPQPPSPLRLEPPHSQWHSKDLRAGDQTHYGDQLLVLLRHLKSGKRSAASFEPERYLEDWVAFWKGDQSKNSYIDHATKATLANYDAGERRLDKVGSHSDEFSAVGRMAPLLLLPLESLSSGTEREDVRSDHHHHHHDYDEREENICDNARLLVALTHNNATVVAAADYFARVVYSIVYDSRTPLDALREVLERVENEFIKRAVRQGLDSVADDTVATVKKFGQSCYISGCLPSTVHIIAKYQASWTDAMEQNIAAGGDSASRGMVVGMVLGAQLGAQAVMSDLFQHLSHFGEVRQLLDTQTVSVG